MTDAALITLALRPFVEPLDLHEWWWFTLLPLSVLVSMAYKAVRLADMRRFWSQVALLTTQIVLAMLAIAAGFFVLVEVVVPALGS